MIAADRWVIDGNYGSSLPARLGRADLAIWLDLPTRVCLAGAMRRMWRWRGQVRPDMREGCPERMDGEVLKFLGYVATFRWKKRVGIAHALGDSGVRVVRLSSLRARQRFAEALPASLAATP